MTLNKFIPPKNVVHSPFPQDNMADVDGAISSGGIAFEVNRFIANLKPVHSKHTFLCYQYFVDPVDGSDTNSGLTVKYAFKTIQKAIDTTPNDLGGAEVFIWLMSGTYTALPNEEIAMINKVNGVVTIRYLGTWANGVAPVSDANWFGATWKTEHIDKVITDDTGCIFENDGVTNLMHFSGGGSLTVYIQIQDKYVTTWNLHRLAYKFKFQRIAGATPSDLRSLRFDNCRVVNMCDASLVFDTARMSRCLLAFYSCAYVVMDAIKVYSTALSGINTADDQWSAIYSANSMLNWCNGYTTGYFSLTSPLDFPATPIEVEGMRRILNILGNAYNGQTYVHIMKYSQGVLPDANPPKIGITADVDKYYLKYHADTAVLVNASTGSGTINETKNAIVTQTVTPKIKYIGDSLIQATAVAEPADALLANKDMSLFIDETKQELNVKLKYTAGTVKKAKIDLVPPLEYTALLSETGYAATSGLLVAGQTYYIASFVAGDDFVNVGGTNVTGNTFVASGTTPTTWTNSSILVSVGISAPAVTLLKNALSAAIVWTYSAVGTYIGTLTGAFTENKTVFSHPPLGNDKAVTLEWTSANVITLKTYETGALKDGLLVKFPLTIKVYP